MLHMAARDASDKVLKSDLYFGGMDLIEVCRSSRVLHHGPMKEEAEGLIEKELGYVPCYTLCCTACVVESEGWAWSVGLMVKEDLYVSYQRERCVWGQWLSR